jgi:hypothetical protein
MISDLFYWSTKLLTTHKVYCQETPYFFWRISTSNLNKIELMRPLCAPTMHARPRRSFSTCGHRLWPPRAASTGCHCALLLRAAIAHCFYVQALRIASTICHCELILRAATAHLLLRAATRTVIKCGHHMGHNNIYAWPSSPRPRQHLNM